jgi:ribosomal protein L28
MRSCPICSKTSAVGGGYSNRVRATKYNPVGKTRRYPNLQWAKLASGGRLKICAKCLKAGKNLTFTPSR